MQIQFCTGYRLSNLSIHELGLIQLVYKIVKFSWGIGQTRDTESGDQKTYGRMFRKIELKREIYLLPIPRLD